MRIDLHTHSTVSDGTDTPTGLVLAAVAAGLDVIALTDHDTFDGVLEAQEAGRRAGITVLSGIEISCEHAGRPVHLVGYGCERSSPRLLTELARVRSARAERLPAMVGRLSALGLEITVDDVLAEAGASPSVGRPHVADALVGKGFVADRAEAFRVYLAEGRPGYVPRYSIPLEQGIDLVHGAHGVAVIAHPWGRGNRDVLTAPYLESLVRGHGLEGIEVDHQDHDAATRSLLFEMGGRLGLIRTGSSDYHGLGKHDHDLGCNLTRASAYRDIVRRIGERGGDVPR